MTGVQTCALPISGGPQHGTQDAQASRLPRAVRPEQPKNLTGTDFKTDAIERREAPRLKIGKPLRQSFNGDHAVESEGENDQA